MIVAPTEPKTLQTLGVCALTPETFGVDFLLNEGEVLVGVQRKTCSDLVASVMDGRLGKELNQMPQLDEAFLLIEGVWQWDNKGGWMGGGRGNGGWDRKKQWGLEQSVLGRGVKIVTTQDLAETREWLEWLEGRMKERVKGGGGVRSSLDGRKGKGEAGRGVWGEKESREWGVWILSGFEGIGVELAGRIWDMYGLPLKWTIGMEEWCRVEGLGVKRIMKLMEVFGEQSPRTEGDGST